MFATTGQLSALNTKEFATGGNGGVLKENYDFYGICPYWLISVHICFL